MAARANAALSKIRDAQIFVMVPPAIISLGQTDGFDMYLTAPAGTDQKKLSELKDEFIIKANQNKTLTMVRVDSSSSAQQLHVDLDLQKALTFVLTLKDVYSTLSGALAGVYVNDFIDRSQIKKVYMQGKADARSKPEDLQKWTYATPKEGWFRFPNFPLPNGLITMKDWNVSTA